MTDDTKYVIYDPEIDALVPTAQADSDAVTAFDPFFRSEEAAGSYLEDLAETAPEYEDRYKRMSIHEVSHSKAAEAVEYLTTQAGLVDF
jgi:hypothetical protein